MTAADGVARLSSGAHVGCRSRGFQSEGPHVQELARRLIQYYRAGSRDLPWRRRRDPYAIWVSEVMLQQTQVDTVLGRYDAFLQEFPSVEALANTTMERVCEAWAGLGYYQRARNLHRAASVVVHELGGCWPPTSKEWRALPGVGRYTAAAVTSIAFAESVAAVDGNVTRVIARVFALPGRVGESRLQRRVQVLAQEVVAASAAPGDLNQALMDLGATICTPAKPKCSQCPVRSLCRATAGSDPAAFPGSAKRVQARKLRMAMAWCASGKGVLLRRRPTQGMWAGLWELPSQTGVAARQRLANELHTTLSTRLAHVEHRLTHRQVAATVYACASVPKGAQGLEWFPDPLQAALSALTRKAIKTVLRGLSKS